jgi:hypothetical protein
MQPADRRPWYRRRWLAPVGIVVVSAALGALVAPDGPPPPPAPPSSASTAPATTVERIAAAKPPAPPPPTTPAPPTMPPPTAAPGACDPSYPDLCLNPKFEDYDCQGGAGDGPRYVDGPIRVRPPDQFDLDSDGDGLGCE